MRKFSQYNLQILKWTCIGLLIRFILMPCTMHGQDLLTVHYFPMMFVKEGIWDPYGFISNNAANFPNTYYGPVLFIIISIVNFIFIKVFHAVSLVRMLEISSTMMFKQFMTVDYVYALAKLDLLKNLFLMKTPYLLFDLLIGAILLRLAATIKAKLRAYKLWMLNVVVLHTTYMVGQFEIIPAFFMIAALFCAMLKRPYLAVVSLSLGGATKLFPYILILPASLLLGQDWGKRLRLLLTAGIVSVALYLPFYLASGKAVFGIFMLSQPVEYAGITRWILTGIFAILYVFISVNAVKDSRAPHPETKLLFYFLTVALLACTVTRIRLRYLVLITPLLALFLAQYKYKKFTIITLLIILLAAFLSLPVRTLQWGLFAPLNPEYLINLPTIPEIIGRFVNLEITYKIASRALLLSFFLAAWWVWRIRLDNQGGLLNLAEGQSR